MARTLMLSLLFPLLFSPTPGSDEPLERPEWAQHFAEAGTQGVFVLYDLQNDRTQVSDRRRAETRFIPASTFKIPNSLIALETGVVADERQVFPWDQVEREIAAWNRDHTLRTAITYSAVPVYQEIARRIGAERMQEHLMRLGYGNADIGGGIDRFWLDGDLRISAMEQVAFLVRLYHNTLPVAERSQRIVKEILINEATTAYILRAKTGYATPPSGRIGWWVGWVEREDNTHFFALNLDVTADEHLAARIGIARAILQAEGVLPP